MICLISKIVSVTLDKYDLTKCYLKIPFKWIEWHSFNLLFIKTIDMLLSEIKWHYMLVVFEQNSSNVFFMNRTNILTITKFY